MAEKNYTVIAWVAEYGEDLGEKQETLGAFVRSAFHFRSDALRTDDEWREIYKTWCEFNRTLHSPKKRYLVADWIRECGWDVKDGEPDNLSAFRGSVLDLPLAVRGTSEQWAESYENWFKFYQKLHWMGS